jgi:two-component system, OmpR family, sensor kinase
VNLPGRFRLRVLAHGLVVVLLMAVAVTIADRFFVNAWVERGLAERRARAANQLSVYGADRSLVASNAEPPIPAPPDDAWASLAGTTESMTRDNFVMSGVFHGGTFAGVVVRRLAPPLVSYPGPPAGLVLLALLACVAATLLASIPLARSVVRPIEALARSVKLFGSGQLSTRASLERTDEIGDLATAFDEMAARIESLVRAEKRLLANVSHELRTPLARIRVVLELASDGDAARVRSYLPEIAHDLEELEQLVDDILATARRDAASDRVDEAKVPMHWTTADLASVVDDSRGRFASRHPDRQLDLVVPGELPELVCDPVLLRRVVDNLLDNAAKYAGGSRIELEVRSDADNVWLKVTDEGPGMSAEVAQRAFDPFYRADESRDRRTGGVGLGLSIVRTIVEAHGGEARIDAAPGRGTSVTARIPRRASVPR